MKTANREYSGKQPKSNLANTKDYNFRISSHVKTLNLPLSVDTQNANPINKDKNSTNKHYEELGLKLRSTQLESTNHEQKMDEAIDNMDLVSNSPKFISKTARIATFSASKHFPQSPIETARKADDLYKTKTERNTGKNQGRDPQKDVELRLSLANFHEKLKTMNFAHKSKTGESEDQFLNLKLQGVQYQMKCDKSNNRYNINSIYKNGDAQVLIKKTRSYKKGFKVSKEELSNLDQFNKLLSKIHLEANQEVPQIAIRRPAKSRRVEVQSASHFRRKQPSKQIPTQARENVKVNIINIAQSKPFQEKPRCHQIYMKYFLKSEDCCIFQRNEVDNNRKPLTPSELTKQLKEIKKEIAQRHTIGERKPLPQQQRFTKYTTSYIEEKLIKRKSLIKNYTFKKNSTDQKKPDAYDDFFVEGWQAEHVPS